jgi:predicted dehydrogenase
MVKRTQAGQLGRRSFLAGTAAAAFTIVKPSLVRGTEANSTVTLGMIGCGGRGNWLVPLFGRQGKYRFVACADYYQDRVDPFGEKNEIPADRRFTGLSGYKRLLEQKLDGVVIETPTYCHPEQSADAVEAGKHVFVAKPIAVDAPGCLSIGESGKKATAKKLVFLIDFQTRADPTYQEAARLVHGGALGKLVCGEARYPWAGGAMPAPATPEERLRYWYCTKALFRRLHRRAEHPRPRRGHLVPQCRPHPGVRHRGQQRAAQVWRYLRSLQLIFWFPNDVALSFMGNQCSPGVPNLIGCRVYGSKGVVDSDYYGRVWVHGETEVRRRSDREPLLSGAENNVRDFYKFITEGHYANETVEPSVRSNLTCVLGRDAAYRTAC